MNELQRIQDLMRRALSGPAWHGDSISTILTGVTAEQAARKPAGAAHSIWELVLHVTVWEDVVLRRLDGPYEITINSAQDWPPVADASPARWSAALERLRKVHQQLIRRLDTFPEAKLSAIVPGGEAEAITYYVLLHGSIHHGLYHAAQMALLKRLSS